jgi:hypothetical protein
MKGISARSARIFNDCDASAITLANTNIEITAMFIRTITLKFALINSAKENLIPIVFSAFSSG